MPSLDSQVAVHSAELVLACSNITWVKEATKGPHCQLADALSDSLKVRAKPNEYHCRLSIVMQQRGVVRELLCDLCSHFVDHSSLEYSVLDFLGYNRDSDLDAYLPATFNALHDRTADICSATSNVVHRHSAAIRQEVLSLLTNLDGSLAVLAARPLHSTFSNPSGPDNAPPVFYRRVYYILHQ